MSTGFYPFWFWNDYLTKEEIQWQIREMANKGIKGFFIHSRQGLKQPYLSERFFQLIDLAIEEAEKYGLIVNIYDEYPYPSGIAGGEVILGKPEYYATELLHKADIIEGGDIRLEYPAGQILSAKTYPYINGKVIWEEEIDVKKYIGIVLVEDSYIETGLTNYNQKRFFASKPTPVLDISLPGDKYKVFVSIQTEVTKHKYWDKYVDVLNKDAIKKYIELTHEKYLQRYEEKFGRSIVSIFTDEIHPTWSDKIIESFKQEYGYDLLDYLPALQDDTHPEHLKVSYDLNQLKYKMFCSSYEEQIANWCNENNLLYVGEKPALRLSQLKFMDIPGCDFGHKKAGSVAPIFSGDIRSNPRGVASVAYFYGKENSLCECYHSLGWSATLQDAKLNAEELLALGIDILVPHGFFYSTHGLRKHDAPPSFFFQMPFWPLFGNLSERIEYIKQKFTDSHLDAEILLIDPTSGIPTDVNKQTYEDILTLLIQAHLDFLIVDTEIIQSGSIKDNILKIKDLTIKLIIVPPMQKIEEPLISWLEKYQSSGGMVIYCEDNHDLANLKDRIIDIVKPELSIKQNNNEIGELLVSKRKNKNKTIWFVVNTSDKKFETLIITYNNLKIKEVLLDKGYTSLTKKNSSAYERVIYPFESFILEAADFKEPESKEDLIPEIIIEMPEHVSIKVKNKNLLRMNSWEMSLLNREGKIVKSSLTEVLPVSNQLKKANFSFKPEFKEYFGHRPELDFPDLSIRYKYSFENHYSGKVELLMEPDTIKGNWVIKVNDKKEIMFRDFYKTDTHIRGSQAVNVSNYLIQGTNNIKVEVSVSQPSDGLINPLYLAGDFGVSLDPVSIVEQKRGGLFEEYEYNFLPFYSGVIEYKTEFNLDNLPDSKFVLIRLQYKRKFQEAAEISINNSNFSPVLWEPRCLKLPTKTLKIGKNTMITRVYTTLIRSFEGKIFDYEEHEYKTIDGRN